MAIRRFMLLSVALLCVRASPATAQFTELWVHQTEAGASYWVFCDVAKTAPGEAPALLFGIPSTSGLFEAGGFQSLRLIDGATGQAIWSFDCLTANGYPCGGITGLSIAGGNGGPYPWKTGPQLIDVDGDGYAEILYRSLNVDGLGWSLHCIKRTGAVAEVNAPVVQRVSVALAQSRPNPTTRGATIDYDLAQSGQAVLALFDAQGRLVRTLADGPTSAGRHSATWDGTDNSGQSLPDGVYYYEIRTLAGRSSKAMIKLH